MTDDEPPLAPPDALSLGDEEAHIEKWKAEVPGLDRVISVAMAIEQPRTADWIADRAYVSPTTARDHLERLVDLHVLSAVEQRGAKTYSPDSAYQRFKEVSQLVETHTREEIESMTITAKAEIETLTESYGVERPDELRQLATADQTSSAEAREYFKRASEWDSHLHTISIAGEALDRYGQFDNHLHPTIDSVA